MLNYNHPIIQENLQQLHQSSVNWKHLKNKTILVTGATGMMASWFTFMLMYLNEHENYEIKLLLLARNKEKLEQIFGRESDNTAFKVQDVCETISVNSEIDYILHAAGSASPYYILNDPVGISRANTSGTLNVLELARISNTRKVIFTSTREIYGKFEEAELLTEHDMGITDPLDSRSCYPESKRMAETLLKSYCIQYGIGFNTLRIAHVYGPGMQIHNDGRVMADLLNDAVNNNDIRLKSDGSAVRAFCYITDAVEAMYRVIIDGKINEAYNVANEKEPITILGLARLISSLSYQECKVVVENGKDQGAGYCNYKRVMLSTLKIESLGWKPKISLSDGIFYTLSSLRDTISVPKLFS